MEDLDTLVLRTAVNWHAAGQPVVLVTVARTWGSSPRPPGSLMAINGRGETVGSVSGGCIEDDLIHRIKEGGVQAACASLTPEVLRYGISGVRICAAATLHCARAGATACRAWTTRSSPPTWGRRPGSS
jgi:xanthine/CO dehydrogenase XdhC/CoxF family maturation factor